jgi:hypothetical protein
VTTSKGADEGRLKFKISSVAAPPRTGKPNTAGGDGWD